VDHHCRGHGLTALRGAPAPRQDRDRGLATGGEGGLHVVPIAGDDHAQWRHLVDGGGGGVKTAHQRVEANLPAHLATEAPVERPALEATAHVGATSWRAGRSRWMSAVISGQKRRRRAKELMVAESGWDQKTRRSPCEPRIAWRNASSARSPSTTASTI